MRMNLHSGVAHRWIVDKVFWWQHGQTVALVWSTSAVSLIKLMPKSTITTSMSPMFNITRANITAWYCGKYHSHPSGLKFTKCMK